MDEEVLRLQGAWENPLGKDECVVRMNDFERDYWMGTEVGQLRGYGFQGAIWPSKQLRVVESTLGVYIALGSFLFLQGQIKTSSSS
jgi:hypothetical protein